MNPQSNAINGSSKVGSSHRERLAFVYVRQSTCYQVENNRESQRRQYDLRELAINLGWPEERIIVIDEDQGHSGSRPGARGGFARIIMGVGARKAGIVMSLEASRLARNSPDWHTLIYMSRYSDTLIADEHGIYDPTDATDRMVLGIRGQMSELELETSIHRMVQGRWNKARRGEYLVHPPVGYELGEMNEVVLTSDEAVASAIRTLFIKFDEFLCVRRLLNWWCSERLKFPVRRMSLRGQPVVWVAPSYQNILYVLHHPFYSGAYVFGRSKSVRELDPGGSGKVRIRRVAVPQDEWPVLLRGHHPAYIEFEKYERNQAAIRENIQMKRQGSDGHQGPAREGAALLQGIVRCGHCGRQMLINYGGGRPTSKNARTIQYRCVIGMNTIKRADCQLIGGKQIDATVVEAFFEVARHAGKDAATLAVEQTGKESEEAERAWNLQIEKAEYDAQRAERQYNAVDPENRVVARTLEARWESRLRRVEELRANAASNREQRSPLTEQDQARARRLGSDVERAWSKESTTIQDKKQLLRSVIEEVQLASDTSHYKVKIIWKGGATTEKEIRRRSRRDPPSNATSKDIVEMVRLLATEFDDAQIARILCRQGRRTGKGNTFTAHKVAALRNRFNIPVHPRHRARDPREGPFTADQAAAELNVSVATIRCWIRDGLLPGTQLAPGAPWRIVLTDETRRRLTAEDAPAGWVGLTEAAKRLGLSKQHVAYLVKKGELAAVRVMVGKRQCWKIDVESATCSKQPNLL